MGDAENMTDAQKKDLEQVTDPKKFFGGTAYYAGRPFEAGHRVR